MLVGDARVGKSTITKLLIELLCNEKKQIKIFNHDSQSKLESHYSLASVESLDFFNGGTDKMLDEMNGNELDAILIDMPGQYLEQIFQYIVEVDLFSVLELCEWKLTFLQPISHRLYCLDYLDKLLVFSGSKADYIVVKNFHFDDRFAEYQQLMQRRLVKWGGVSLKLDALHRDIYKKLENSVKPYSQVWRDSYICVLYRSYIYRWIENFNRSVLNDCNASKYIGLSNGSDSRQVARTDSRGKNASIGSNDQIRDFSGRSTF
jgi:hypothetical protein